MAKRYSGNRLAVLDGLRLLAALMVVFYHYVALARPWGHPTDTYFPTAHKLAQYGWLGVEIVFLISCFVICMSAWGRTAGEFAVSRLFPAYWVGIVLTALVVKMWPEITSQHGWGTVITNLTMLQGGNNTPNQRGPGVLDALRRAEVLPDHGRCHAVRRHLPQLADPVRDMDRSRRPRPSPQNPAAHRVRDAAVRAVLHRRHRLLPDAPLPPQRVPLGHRDPSPIAP
ncbi:acyltransferase family protein [Streptomyces decoyicus]